MTKIEKLETWSITKIFEADSLEEALAIAESDSSEDWQFVEDDSVTYYVGDENA